MTALHVVLPAPKAQAQDCLAPVFEALGLTGHGSSVTANIAEADALVLLSELCQAVMDLGVGACVRRALRLHSRQEPWELGLETDGEDLLLSLYTLGRSPEIAIAELRLSHRSVVEVLSEALDAAPIARAPRGIAAALLSARRRLGSARPFHGQPRRELAPVCLKASFGPTWRVELALSLRKLPSCSAAPSQDRLDRADLHALLAHGDLELEARGRKLTFNGVPGFLFAEAYLLLAEEVLDAALAERALHRRAEVAPLRLGVQRSSIEQGIRVTVWQPGKPGREALVFPGVQPFDFVRCATSVALQLCQALVAVDPQQSRNLRVSNLTAQARHLEARLEEAASNDSVVNHRSEQYRPYAAQGSPRPASAPLAPSRMRFAARWMAAVAQLDLKAIFLHGERLLVGAAHELACLDRQSGAIGWRAPTRPGTTVLTPLGLVRWHQDGLLCLHELESGQVRFGTYVMPRPSGSPTGAVVHAPGLPRLLVVAEGDRSISALDLVTGEILWRHTARRPANFRVKRAGRLLLVAGGDSALVALDAVSGEAVWRLRCKLPFSGDLIVERDSAFACCGGPVGPVELLHIDACSGEVRWKVEVGHALLPGQAPLLAGRAVVAATRDRRGLGLSAWSREAGAPLWEKEPGLATRSSAFLAVDDSIIVNSAAGMLSAYDAALGTPRFSHAFAHPVDADQPRRLEPVLRGGALFVPQQQVHVIHARSGDELGTVPTDLVADSLRVDERSNVYVAEESGHLAAYGAAPRLSLVKA